MIVIRIAYSAQAPFDGIGIGGGPRVKSLVHIFDQLGYETDLISYSFHAKKNCIEQSQKSARIRQIVINTHHALPKFLKVFAVIPGFLFLLRSCKKSDIILADFNCLISAVPAVFLGKVLNKPVILDCIDTKLDPLIPGIVYSLLARNSDMVFAISHYLENQLISRYGCRKAVYLPIFIDSDKFTVDPEGRQEIRNQYHFADSDIVIGYVGSYTYYEGVPVLIKAYNTLSRSFPDLRLAIMGKVVWKTLDDDLEKLIDRIESRDSVVLLPPQDHEDVPKYLSGFDILCCPKIDCEINRAANPVKVAEYLSMGIPTVASEIGGIPDLIENNISGLLVKPGDPEDLAKKIEWVIRNRGSALEIGATGRKIIVQNYSYYAYTTRMQKFLDDLISSKKRS